MRPTPAALPDAGPRPSPQRPHDIWAPAVPPSPGHMSLVSQAELPLPAAGTANDDVTRRSMLTLCGATAQLGLKGGQKTFEELRRAIASAQAPGGQERLHIAGALARWFALGCQGPAPTTWHLLVELTPEKPGQEVPPDAPAEAARRIAKRLAKRNFMGARASGQEVALDAPQAPQAVLLRVCRPGSLSLPEARACEQLTYALNDKSWHLLPHLGITRAQAQHYLEAGFWRVPEEISPSNPLDTCSDAGIAAGRRAFAELTVSWRQQQAGFSPTDVLDQADVPAIVALMAALEPLAALPPQEAQRHVVSLLHDALAPALTPAGTEARTVQLGLAAVALHHLNLITQWHDIAAPLRLAAEAAHGFVLSQGDWAKGSLRQALTLTRTLSARADGLACLRLLMQASQSTALLETRAVMGMRAPMLRVALPELRTHLFVPGADHDEVAAHPAAWGTPFDLARGVAQTTSLPQLVALCLDIPAVASLGALAQVTEAHQRTAWAKALARAARGQPFSRRLCTAIALLHPGTFAALPVDWQLRSFSDVDLLQALGAAAARGDTAPEMARDLRTVAGLRWQLRQPGADLPAPLVQSALQAAIAAKDDAIALTLSISHLQLLPGLPEDERVWLFAAAVRHRRIDADVLLDHVLPTHAPVFWNNDVAAACKAACALPHLLPGLAKVMARNTAAASQLWPVFFKAARQARDKLALQNFVCDAPNDHPQLHAATCALSEALDQRYDDTVCRCAAIGFKKLMRHANACGLAPVVETTTAILRLHQSRRSHTGEALCDDHELAFLIKCTLEQGADVEQRAVALDAVAGLTHGRCRGSTFVSATRLVDPSELLSSAPAMWREDFAAHLSDIAPHLPALDAATAERLHKLVAAMVQTNEDKVDHVYRSAAAAAQVLLQQGYEEGACVALFHAAVHSHAGHTTADALGANAIVPFSANGWVRVVELAAGMLNSFRFTPETVKDPQYSSRVRLFEHLAARAIEARCDGARLQAAAPDRALEAMQQAARLLVAVAQFTTLSANSHSILTFKQGLIDSGTQQPMQRYLLAACKNLEHHPSHTESPYGALPACIVATPLRAMASADGTATAARARAVLLELFGTSLDAATAVPKAHASAAAYAYAIEMADMLLQGWPDEAQMLSVVQRLATARLHDNHLLAHLDTLARHLPEEVCAGPHHPLRLAAQHIIEARRGHKEHTAAEQQALERASFNTCFALRISTSALDEKSRMAIVVRMIESIQTLAPESRRQWSAITSGPSFLAALDDAQRGAIAQFRRTFALDAAGEPSPLIDVFSLQASLRAQHDALLARLQGPRGHQRQQAIDALLSRGQYFENYRTEPYFKDFQQNLSTLLSDRSFFVDMTESLVDYLISSTLPPLRMPFIAWLSDAFLLATPLTSTQLALVLALLDVPRSVHDRGMHPTSVALTLVSFSPRAIQTECQAARLAFGQLREEVRAAPEGAPREALLRQHRATIVARLHDLMPKIWPPRPEAIVGPLLDAEL